MPTEHRKWIEYLARAGYASRGVVYLIIGSFALLAATGPSSNKDSKGAISQLLGQPFGVALLWMMMVGLVGYVIWRVVQSLFDTDDHGYSIKGLAVRAGLLASAFTYAALALYSASLLGLTPGASGGSGDDNVVKKTLERFAGSHRVSLGLALVFTGVAIAHWWKVISGKYEKHFRCSENRMALVHGVSVIGLTARGVVFAIVGLLLFYRFTGRDNDDGETPDIKDVFSFVEDLPMGSWLLGALGVGILAFAAYSIVLALWRRINMEDA